MFGNDRRVPELRLQDYGNLVAGVEFYFIDEGGRLGELKVVFGVGASNR